MKTKNAIKTKIYRWEYWNINSNRWCTYCFSSRPDENPCHPYGYWSILKTRRHPYLASRSEMIYLFRQGGCVRTGNLKSDVLQDYLIRKGRL